MSSQIDATENEIRSREIEITKKTAKKERTYSLLLRTMKEYSADFSLAWPDSYPDVLEDDEIPKESETRSLIQQELEFYKNFKKSKSDQHNKLQKEISALKKLNPGKLRRLERRTIQRKIEQAESLLSQVRETRYPRGEKLQNLQALLAILDALAIKKTKHELSRLRNQCDELHSELIDVNSKKTGEAFEKSCSDFVEAERAKRRNSSLERKIALEREAKQAERESELRRRKRKQQQAERERMKEIESRRVKARSASLKSQVRKSETFLAQHSEKSAVRDLQNKKRVLESRQRQLLRSEEACVRKIKQLNASGRVFLFSNFGRDKLLEALQKQEWHQIPALDNLVVKLKEVREDHDLALREVRDAEALVRKIADAKDKIEEFERIAHLLEPDTAARRGAPPRIPVENWDDAEELAVRYIKWLGFTDAKRTAAGSDEGKDVESAKCVAQVKDMGTGATRPMLQQLFGVASAEKKTPMFFSRGYAKTALEWGEKHGIALFKFDLRGTVTPLNTAARKLVTK